MVKAPRFVVLGTLTALQRFLNGAYQSSIS